MIKIRFELSQGYTGEFFVTTKKTYDKKTAKQLVKYLNSINIMKIKIA